MMQKKRVWGVIFIIIVSLLFLSLPYVFYVAKQTRMMEVNFCPNGNYWQNYFGIKIGKASVVLIDTSNFILKEDGQVAAIWVEKWIRRFPPFQQISIHALPKTAKLESEIITDYRCVSWNKGTAPAWLTGGLIAERDFRKKFLAEIQAEFDEAINLSEADESPILEKLATLKAEGINSVFLVSDMLQHTNIEKHYKDGSRCDDNCPDIKGMDINIYYIKREGVDRPANHRQIWEQHVGKEITWHSFETKK